MNKIVYDISLLVALALIGTGVWLQWGTPPALIVLGVLVLLLTMVAPLFAVLRRRG